MNPAPAAIQTNKPLRTSTRVEADSNGNVPTKIELLKAGVWPASSNKGSLTITVADLQEMKSNFDRGVGIAGGIGKLPIDFSHNEWSEAAGWISQLEVEGDTLYSVDTEWTTTGQAKLSGGEYKLISPSFYPGCLGEWSDPEDADITARNVLVGAGLTNIPFFKKLTPIMASNSSDNDRKNNNVIYIEANKETPMTLDEVRVKDAADLSDEDKKLLADNKDQLSADEQAKFGLIEADNKNPKENKVAETAEQKEAMQIQADIKSGKKVLVDADAHKSLETRVEAAEKQLNASREKEVTAAVNAAVGAGKIVADQKDNWVKRIIADATMQEVLETLPENKIVADTNTGNEANKTGAVTAAAELKERAEKLMADNTDMSYRSAILQVKADDQDLTDRLKAEAEEAQNKN